MTENFAHIQHSYCLAVKAQQQEFYFKHVSSWASTFTQNKDSICWKFLSIFWIIDIVFNKTSVQLRVTCPVFLTDKVEWQSVN